MAITRVTQNMLTRQSLGSLQANLGRMAKLQEQLSTGRVINRPSDSPTGTVSAMRLRDTMAANEQHQRSAQDGIAWLGVIDQSLTSLADQTMEARDIAIQGASSGSVGQAARNALASSVDQIREGLLATANTSYLGRPVLGGITGGSKAYELQPDGVTISYVGDNSLPVERTVAEGVTIRVDADATAALGPGGDDVFAHLDSLSTALRAGDDAGVKAGLAALNGDLARLTTARAEVGTRAKRIDAVNQAAADSELTLKASLSQVENADLPETIVNLKMQEAAYQSALAATARVMQPSLMDFLR